MVKIEAMGAQDAFSVSSRLRGGGEIEVGSLGVA